MYLSITMKKQTIDIADGGGLRFQIISSEETTERKIMGGKEGEEKEKNDRRRAKSRTGN